MKNMYLTVCQKAESQAEKAGFQFYTSTSNEDHGQGVIMINNKKESPFNGECLDLFEDGTIHHYSQFKGVELKFKF